MGKRRVVTWRVEPSAGLETSWVSLRGSALTARGRAVGTTPSAYWLEYELETDSDFVTRLLRVTVEDADGPRRLELRNSSGTWIVNGEEKPALGGALDCDLGLCPLTNTMPILRHGLHVRPGRQELLMAWVAVPELTVRPSRQTYTHLAVGATGGEVRYASGSFSSDLQVDGDGLVIEYPQLATRIAG